VQQLAQPDEAVLQRFAVDVLDIGRMFNTTEQDWYPTTLMDGSSAYYPCWFHPEPKPGGGWIARASDGTAIAEMPAAGTFFDQICFPYRDGYPHRLDDLDSAMGKVLWAALVHSPWDHVRDQGFWDTLRLRTLELRNSTDKALMVVVGCNLFEWGTFLRRMDNFLMDLVTAPHQVERLLDALVQRHLRTLENVCQAVGDLVDIVRFGDDLGMDSGPFMSPDIYRRLFKPRHAAMCEYVQTHSSMHTFLHSCGSIRPLIPDLIEAGFEILNPVQTSCRGMDPVELKREFGSAVTFWGGGCDTRQVLNRATPSEIKAHVLKRLEIFAPGGGYVFNSVHNILPDVPPENVVAMFDAVQEFNGR
jgi:uroporphyrinogen decarboxylase